MSLLNINKVNSSSINDVARDVFSKPINDGSQVQYEKLTKLDSPRIVPLIPSHDKIHVTDKTKTTTRKKR